MRARKPWVRFLFITLGWNVRFIGKYLWLFCRKRAATYWFLCAFVNLNSAFGDALCLWISSTGMDRLIPLFKTFEVPREQPNHLETVSRKA